jgi:hypothetical protein
MKNPSKRHHYLPRHYLRGFTDGTGTFFVYDKQTGKIFHTSPDAAFFENDLNTLTLPDGTTSDLLEALYTDVENGVWSSLDRIRNSTPDAPIDLWYKMDLFLFLSFLHWRLPSNIAFAEELSQRSFAPDSDLSFFKLESTDGSPIAQETIDTIKASPWWKKAARTIAPFAPFYSGGWGRQLASWRLIYPTDDSRWYIVGDNPIVTDGRSDHDPMACLNDFVFPVSGRILLISRGEHMSGMLPAELPIQYGSAIIERARRFVACHDRSFLEAMLSDHELYVRFGKTDRIIPDLFEMLGRAGKG